MSKSPKEKPFNLKSFCVSALRRSFLRSATRQQFLIKHRFRQINPKTGKECFFIKCADCKEDIKQGDIKVDHIEPIVTTDQGWTSLDDFAKRLFCMKEIKGFPNLDELQPLCKGCHDEKTKRERAKRKSRAK